MFNESMMAKLAKLREAGKDVYPPRVPKPTSEAETVKANFEKFENQTVTIAGRITAQRGHGKAMFLEVADETGPIQLYVRVDDVGEEIYGLIRDALDVGDLVVVTGSVFKTRTGEVTIHTKEIM
ncbi:MAG TPA: OB-fold nucleic acid binding domain-containing protein [Caldisericia bacterium]|nr:OB-fold nucleic acid binding domain-containing protein [Caldisericia bacterium]